jgi:hypothetical protein
MGTFLINLCILQPFQKFSESLGSVLGFSSRANHGACSPVGGGIGMVATNGTICIVISCWLARFDGLPVEEVFLQAVIQSVYRLASQQ